MMPITTIIFTIVFISVEVFQSLERWQKCIYFYTELLNYLQNTYVGSHFCQCKVFSEQELTQVQIMIRKVSIYFGSPVQAPTA